MSVRPVSRPPPIPGAVGSHRNARSVATGLLVSRIQLPKHSARDRRSKGRLTEHADVDDARLMAPLFDLLLEERQLVALRIERPEDCNGCHGLCPKCFGGRI